MRAVITLTVPGTSSAGRARLQAMRRHVVHVAVKALRQPGQQTRLGRGQIDAGHADLGESEFPAPGLNA